MTMMETVTPRSVFTLNYLLRVRKKMIKILYISLTSTEMLKRVFSQKVYLLSLKLNGHTQEMQLQT